MKLLFTTPIDQPFEKIRERFNQNLFTYLAPPFLPVKILRFDGIKKNDEIHLKLGPGQHWISLITLEATTDKGWSFIDEGKVLPWPLIFWKHHHRVDRISETSSQIVDDIEFECRPKVLGPLIRPILWSVFAVRPRRYQQYFKDIS